MTVVINGIRWATRNVDAPGSFVVNREDAGMFYQWGRRIGWSSTDPLQASDGSSWPRTLVPGVTWHSTNDPCPTGWRVPTQVELQSLVNAGFVSLQHNDTVIGYLFGTYPNQVFLPLVGYRDSNGRLNTGLGRYWSSTPSLMDGPIADYSATFYLRLERSNTYARANLVQSRILGQLIRCVAQ